MVSLVRLLLECKDMEGLMKQYYFFALHYFVTSIPNGKRN